MHGYLADKRSFNRQIPFFSRDFDVHAIDLKGFGENQGMPFPYALSDYLLEVKEYVYKFNLKKPSVIAHSFGGRIAVKGAAEDPELFDKIVLTGAAGLKPRPSLKKVAKKTVFKVLKTFAPKEKLVRFYSPDYQQLSPIMKESFKLIVNEYLDGVLGKIKNKTLVINGANDRETPPYMAKRLYRGIENSELIFIKGAGHFCFIDKCAKFNTEVREFLLS